MLHLVVVCRSVSCLLSKVGWYCRYAQETTISTLKQSRSALSAIAHRVAPNPKSNRFEFEFKLSPSNAYITVANNRSVPHSRPAQVSNITFKFDPNQPGGSRIVSGSVTVKGAPLDLNAKYSMATKEYLSLGKDGFDCLLGARVITDGGE